MNGNIWGLLPVFIFMMAMLAVSIYLRNAAAKKSSGNFLNEYFTGSRSLGGFVLAMTTVATYSSVSSFVGGPGQAWDIGFGWIYMSVVQVTALFLVLGILGKKMAIVSRKIDAVTVIDVIRHRYQSDLLANLSAIIIVLFFSATMVAQFVGGAKLFEAVTGYSYVVGLVVFGLVVVVYTAVGGFRGVAVTDALCAIAMLVGMFILLVGILQAGGGYEAIMEQITVRRPELLEPLSGGNMPYTLYISQWMLVGIFTVGLPQSVVRCITYKDTKSLHRAIIIGTVVIGAMNIGMNFIGVLSQGILTEDLAAYGNSVDNIMPLAIVRSLSPLVAGITIIGPIAASISTISSLLLTATSSIIKDVYMYEKEKSQQKISEKKTSMLSQLCTLVLGLIIFFISINPPDVIWKINMFAFGGLETAFFWVFILGMFWKKANKTGAIWAMAGGTVVYCLTMLMGIKIMEIHQILIGIVVSLLCMIIGSYVGKDVDKETLGTYFCE
ncbi:sodium/pantothenate symporter [Eubacterium sp. An3]|uniref:sodium/pantothenate symporter n=1 Tax=Eubacterium sp. An3 TaxID=1965628 RepID=UPI000B58651B|nr:sodium/pantothenate symporter [Eubacterium sp. An3]OUO30246.1 sodium/panthothenate symporter [Eubacterium sp. An3]